MRDRVSSILLRELFRELQDILRHYSPVEVSELEVERLSQLLAARVHLILMTSEKELLLWLWRARLVRFEKLLRLRCLLVLMELGGFLTG